MLFRLLRFMDYDEVYGLAEGLAWTIHRC